MLVPCPQIRGWTRCGRTGLRRDAHHNLHPRFQDSRPESMPSSKLVPVMCMLTFGARFFEIIAFIRTVVGNKCICITRAAALMSRFVSGVSLKRNPHVIHETPALLSHRGSPPRFLISWCALRISVRIAASNKVMMTIWRWVLAALAALGVEFSLEIQRTPIVPQTTDRDWHQILS
jgi:hypothetical protein